MSSAKASRLRLRGLMGAPFLLAAAMVLVGTGTAHAAEAPTAQINQDGWWNRFQGPQEGEPAGNPIRPVIPRIPAPPSVPADSIAVGASANQVDKVAAVGIDVLAPTGGTVEAMTLRLKQSPGNGSNINADMAKVSACPITNPWGSDKNANWADRPQADCNLAKVEGQRADAEWSFDLTPMGTLWADPASGILPNGVLLSVEPVPGVVQVSWVGFDAGGLTLEFAASAPPDEGTFGSSSGDAAFTESTAPVTTEESFTATETSLGYDDTSSFSSDTSAYSGETSFDATAPPESTGAAAPTLPPATPSGGQPASSTRPTKVWGNLPAPSVLLLPTVIGLALLVGWALGPTGRPLPAHHREGGLSRALSRRRGMSVS
jgi:hypothetical protein